MFSDGPHAGAFGAAAADLRVPAEQLVAERAVAASLRTRALWLERGALGLFVVALTGTLAGAWHTRRDVRQWPWRSLVGFPLTLACFVADGSTSSPVILVFMAFEALVVAGAVFDLRRRKRGIPGRTVAWGTALAASALFVFLGYTAAAPGGIISRWW